MSTLRHTAAALLLGQFLLALPALAQESAPQLSPQATPAPVHKTCTIEGTMIVNKKQVAAKDCFENAGAPQDDFERVCNAMEQTAIAVTRSANTPAPKFAYGDSCPAGAVAKCKGFLFMPILHHIFKRSDHEMEVARESCLTQNGEWKLN